ncbi:hypothetical protein GN956_G24838 [Arapaima gigas]
MLGQGQGQGQGQATGGSPVFSKAQFAATHMTEGVGRQAAGRMLRFEFASFHFQSMGRPNKTATETK